jgi:hypothetical protein
VLDGGLADSIGIRALICYSYETQLFGRQSAQASAPSPIRRSARS